MRSRVLFLSAVLPLSCASGSPTAQTHAAVRTPSVLQDLRAFAPFRDLSARRPLDGRLRAELPSTAAGAMRVSLTEDASFYLDVRADDLRAGTRDSEPDAVVHRDAAVDLDVVHVVTDRGPEELRIARSPKAPLTLRHTIHHGPSVAAVRVAGDVIEAVDVAGIVRLRTEPMFAIDAAGVRIPLSARIASEVGNDVVVVTEPTRPATQYPVAIDPLWTAGTVMKAPRMNHRLVTLGDGRALAAGGNGLSSSEIYDPAAKTWTLTGSMTVVRSAFSAVTLKSGDVFAFGGNGAPPLKSGETYSVATGRWTATPIAIYGRTQHTATVLADGRVLLVGGYEVYNPNSVEIYNPTTRAFTGGPPLKTPRKEHTATLLPSGKVLITGGFSNGGGAAPLATTEIIDPAVPLSAAFAKPMTNARWRHHAFRMPSGRVVVIGGVDASMNAVANIEIYDEATDTWTSAGTSTSIFLPVGTQLQSGDALLTGAFDATVGYFEGGPGSFKSEKITGIAPRHAATLLGNGSVLVAGGDVGLVGPAPTAATWLFTPYANGTACTSARDCLTGNCVDSVCCDTACVGKCAACDVPAKIGTCTPVVGAPHGSRGACAAGGGDVCKESSCNGVEPSRCVLASTETVCGEGTCAGGTELGVSRCDGTGACGTPVSKSCLPYKCGPKACLSSCASASDCADGYDCRDSTCQPHAATCSTDGGSVIGVDKSVQPCAPFVCKAGKCVETCGGSDDCAAGSVCDPSGRCIAPGGVSGEDDGGCAISFSSPANRLAACATFIALVALGRRRRARVRG
jgi:hypothetical protein